ncbi:uncharacterized protein A4U43_C07F15960 [Asparagus officinalis]|uniref:Uncharacterized protein n=1 Tax=Asparagus officinalis TaxID=4686 RepID=A0A5P1EHH3_ASPOF|nr:uncharacterized protein A4U43_C07F15960 [Asparagus officinalis]
MTNNDEDGAVMTNNDEDGAVTSLRWLVDDKVRAGELDDGSLLRREELLLGSRKKGCGGDEVEGRHRGGAFMGGLFGVSDSARELVEGGRLRVRDGSLGGRRLLGVRGLSVDPGQRPTGGSDLAVKAVDRQDLR